jgi:hypothetical protein
MASMELTAKDSMEEGMEAPEAYRPRWAVNCLYLSDEALQALGIAEPLKLGTMVQVTGMAKVMSAELREDQQGESENCMSIQLIELELAPAKKPMNAAAMYPNSKMGGGE